MVRALLIAAVALALACPAARGDADPPSDVLFVQDYYLPYSPKTSRPLAGALRQVVRETRAAGLPLRVVIISTRADLGAVPKYFGSPQPYARFLHGEIAFQKHVPLLVVQPSGFGAMELSGAAKALDGLKVDNAHGANGLVRSGVIAAERVARAAGHPVAPIRLPAATVGGKTEGGTSALTFILPVATVVLALAGFALVTRARGR